MTTSGIVAAGEAARELVGAGASSSDLWRLVVLQAVDDYESTRRAEGLDAAVAAFSDEPAATGDDRVDAALAALTEHLARRDGWPAPAWVRDESRTSTHWWFVDSLQSLRVFALRESPLSFRKRGVFVGDGGLQRV